MDDDQRAAANLFVTSVGQLITAALAVLAVVGALTTFTLDKRVPELGFYICVGGAGLLLIASTVAGANAANRVHLRMSQGSYNPQTGLADFRYVQVQFVLFMLGILAFALSFFFFGPAKADSLSQTQSTQKELMDQNQYQEAELQRLDEEITNLKESGITESSIDSC